MDELGQKWSIKKISRESKTFVVLFNRMQKLLIPLLRHVGLDKKNLTRPCEKCLLYSQRIKKGTVIINLHLKYK